MSSDIEAVAQHVPVNYQDIQMAESEAWAPFFAAFDKDLDVRVKAQIAKQFVDSISKDLARIFRRSLQKAKEFKRMMTE